MQVNVKLAKNSYPIVIEPGLLQTLKIIEDYITGNEVVVITNNVLADLLLPTVKSQLKCYDHNEIILPDGEQYKNFDSLNKIFDELIAKQCTRQTTLIALGGGVIGDMTGFAAACYQRGIAFIQIPTTLLAQVDASVGGKTAVNHSRAKNMIGAFYQPQCVLIDPLVLNTLPAQHFHAGLAEVIKYGLIQDAEFTIWLSEHHAEIMAKNPEILITMISRCCQLKADIVAVDEREAGLRAILNFGHTIGHALEVMYGYENILHGEAVAQGMFIESHMSYQLGMLDEAEYNKIIDVLTLFNFTKPNLTKAQCEQLITLMQHDKKVKTKDSVRFVLLNSIGQPELIDIKLTDLHNLICNN